MGVVYEYEEKAVNVNINSKEFLALTMVVVGILTTIVHRGDDGSQALCLLVILLTNSAWFIKTNYGPKKLSIAILGALIFDAGLLSLYFFHDYKAALTLVIYQLAYLFIFAVYGKFVRKQRKIVVEQ